MGKRKTAHIEKLRPDIGHIGKRVYGSSFKLNQDLGVNLIIMVPPYREASTPMNIDSDPFKWVRSMSICQPFSFGFYIVVSLATII
jgi:hypothetical protein